jgi:hypothetical protein
MLSPTTRGKRMSALAAPAAGSRLATNDSIDMFLVDMQGSARAHGF